MVKMDEKPTAVAPKKERINPQKMVQRPIANKKGNNPDGKQPFTFGKSGRFWLVVLVVITLAVAGGGYAVYQKTHANKQTAPTQSQESTNNQGPAKSLSPLPSPPYTN